MAEEKHHLPPPLEEEEDYEDPPHHNPNPHHSHTLPSPEKTPHWNHDHPHPQQPIQHPKMMNEGGKHGGRVCDDDSIPDNTCRSIFIALATLLLVIGITALVVYLVYRPEKPQFRISGVSIYNLNATTPPFITTTMQFTLITRNPNKRVSIFYDRLSTFVSYRNQAITQPAPLPPLHHKVKSTVALSPVVGGIDVPVAPEVANGLLMDQTYGVVVLRVVVMGRLRYKGGAIKSRHYKVSVMCDIMVGMKRGVVGQMPLLGPSGCKVDI